VKPEYGDWTDVEKLGNSFHLMFDSVANHISAQSEWFQGYLKGEEKYQDFFVEVEGDPDISEVTRPRSLPLLTEVETARGPRKVWTTFSADQVDLNYANPLVLIEMTRVLLTYVEHGASLIRLNAIAFLWKIIGTTCIHLEETHEIIKLWRDVLDVVAPHVVLVSETNVPHKENISYF